MTRARTTLVLLAALALLVGVAVYAAYATRTEPFAAPTRLETSAPEGLDAYYGQKLRWSECGAGHCAWVTVPIDYADPTGETTRIRVKMRQGDGATRSLFVNPGGPGGSAVDFADGLFNRFSSDLLDTYDVVGVDPRGVGLSTPLKCLSDKKFDESSAGDPDPDDAAEVRELRDGFSALGEACLKNSGDLAAHVSTVEVARDMDVVRALIGRKKLDWFGASYGTELGATYAQLFPDMVGRMVLDGAVDPTLDEVESNFAQATGFQRALKAYVDDCVTSDGCPLGDDADEGVQRVAGLMDQLDAKPLPGKGDRLLTEGRAFYGIAVTLYDEQTWPLLTAGLKKALDGDGSDLVTLSDAYFERNKDGSYGSNMGQVITAVTCLDSPGGLSEADVRAQIPRFVEASPVFGRALAWGALGCADWPIEATNPLPAIDGKGAPPILVVGTTRDPATPYESAQALAKQLESGVLLTRDGDGHTAYLSGNECIQKAVDTYLLDGTMPAEDTTC